MDSVVEMLQHMDGPSRDKLLANVRAQDPRLAAQLAERIWTLEELLKLDRSEIQMLLRAVPAKTWALALREAADALKDHLFGNLSKAAGDSLREDINALGPQHLSKVESAHLEIRDIMDRLIAAGQLRKP